MSKVEKLVKKLLSRPRNFTYNELRNLLLHLGYREHQSGKTSGFRVAFTNEKTKHIIRLHKPHPGNELKQYQMEQIIEELNLRRLL